MAHTPLSPGESIVVGSAARLRARRVVDASYKSPADRAKFYFGLGLQYEHDQCFVAAGMPFDVFENLSDPFDRLHANQWQDDKASLRGKTITISQGEYASWQRVLRDTDDDVVINVFDQQDDDHTFTLLGSYSFRKISQKNGNHPIIHPSQYGPTVYIFKTALKDCEA